MFSSETDGTCFRRKRMEHVFVGNGWNMFSSETDGTCFWMCAYACSMSHTHIYTGTGSHRVFGVRDPQVSLGAVGSFWAAQTLK